MWCVLYSMVLGSRWWRMGECGRGMMCWIVGCGTCTCTNVYGRASSDQRKVVEMGIGGGVESRCGAPEAMELEIENFVAQRKKAEIQYEKK